MSEQSDAENYEPEIFPDRSPERAINPPMGSRSWPIGEQLRTAHNPTPRETILRGATEAVMRQRNNAYGPPTQDFRRSAGVCNALGFRVVDAQGHVSELQPHHIAMIQHAVKLSRLTWTPAHLDSWMDVAGYAACGYECAEEEARIESAAKAVEGELD